MDSRAKLRLLMALPGVSSAAVARRARVSRSLVDSQRTGRRRVTPAVLAAALDVALDVLHRGAATIGSLAMDREAGVEHGPSGRAR